MTFKSIDYNELNALRDSVSLHEIIALDVVLTPILDGQWKGLCPFHDDATPSFMVSEAHHIFHCFGCGVGGDIFGWFMRKRGQSFPEAIESVRRMRKHE